MSNDYRSFILKIFDGLKGYSVPLTVETVIVLFNICFAISLNINNKKSQSFTYEDMIANVKVKLYKEKNEELNKAFDLLSKYNVDNKKFNQTFEAIASLYNIEEIKYVMNYLIESYLIEMFYKEHQTPQVLSQLAITILNPSNGTFYDGTAGIGTTARLAHEYATTHGGTLQIYTQEIFILFHAVSVILNYSHGINNAFQKQGDIFVTPAFLIEENLKQFDYSIMFPPFGQNWSINESYIKNDPFNRFIYGIPPSSTSDWLFAMHQIASLSEKGKGIICMPSGSLFNASTQKIRSKIISSGLIDCIITLPTNIFPFTAASISLVVFDKSKRTDPSILMINAETIPFDHDQPDNFIQALIDILSKREENTEISQITNLKAIQDNILLPSTYIHENYVDTMDFGKVQIFPEPFENTPWKKLEVVGEFYRGINTSKIVEETKNSIVQVIKYSDVQNNELHIDSLTSYELKGKINIEKYRVRSGDILVSCKGPAVKICIVPKHSGIILLSLNFIGIRVDQANFNSQYIKYYLESPLGIYFIQNRQKGSSIIMLNLKDLQTVPFPNIPLIDQQQKAHCLKTKEQEIEQQMDVLYTQKKQAKKDFYEQIGLGKIIKLEED